MITPAAYAAAVVARGVTTIVWDPHEFGNVHGVEGVRWAAKSIENLPLRAILLAPPQCHQHPVWSAAALISMPEFSLISCRGRRLAGLRKS